MDSIEDDFAFYSAIEQGDLELVKDMISKGVDIRSNNDRPLRLALEHKHRIIEDLLILNGAILPEETPSWLKFPTLKQITALIQAGKLEDSALEKKYKYSLIGKPIKTDIDKRDNLREIIKLNNCDLLKKYMEHYNITNVNIHEALDLLNIDIVEHLMKFSNKQLSKKVAISVIFKAIKNENTSIIDNVLKLSKIDLHNIIQESLNNPSGWHKNYDALKFVLKGDYLSQEFFTSKILNFAIKFLYKEQADLVYILLTKSPSYTKKDLVVQAIRAGKLHFVEGNLEHYDIQKALMSAIYFGHLDIVKYLIENGGDPSKFNEKGLRLALRCNRKKIAVFLMTHGSKAEIALKYCCNKYYRFAKEIVDSFNEIAMQECGICLTVIGTTEIFKCKVCKKIVHRECQNKWRRRCIYCRN